MPSNEASSKASPTERVLIRAASYLLTGKTRSLHVLSAAGIGWSRSLTNLPSWVPDWSDLPSVLEEAYSKWFRSVSADESIFETLCENIISAIGSSPRVLKLRGIILDEVKYEFPSTCPKFDEDDDPENMDTFEWLSLTAQFAHSLSPYPSGEHIEDVYWCTLITASNDLGGPAGLEYGDSFRQSMMNPFSHMYLDSRPDIQDIISRGRSMQKSHQQESISDTRSESLRKLHDHEVEMRCLVETLHHHLSSPDVTPELALMDRLSHERSFELDRIWGRAYGIYGVGRCLFITKKGFLGIGPPGIKAGDKIAKIPGSEKILTLRPYVSTLSSILSTIFPSKGKSDSASAFQLVGDCYVHGYSGGDVGWSKKDLQEIDLY